jgi:hypothetical protein
MSDEIEPVETPVIQLFDESEVNTRLAARDAEWEAKLASRDVELSALRGERDTGLIERALTAAATAEKAYHPEQILSVLQSKTRLIDGKPVVEIEGYTMTATEALKWMVSQPEKYGNLFNNFIGGIGGTSTAAGARGPRATDPRNQSPEAYRAGRSMQ